MAVNMMMNDITKKYDQEFFDYTISSELGSSPDVAGILMKYYHPKSVIDIGCGCGIYIKAFHDLGIEDVIGYDGSKHALEKGLLPEKIFLHDLREHIFIDRKYDLCLCIEVAEHIDNEYSVKLVQTLTNASDVVFFTAASPGQGGLHHVNEQPYEFWEGIFHKFGFRMDDRTEAVCREMAEKGVIYWIVRNAMIFVNHKHG